VRTRASREPGASGLPDQSSAFSDEG
jgi:hypothetical protein